LSDHAGLVIGAANALSIAAGCAAAFARAGARLALQAFAPEPDKAAIGTDVPGAPSQALGARDFSRAPRFVK